MIANTDVCRCSHSFSCLLLALETTIVHGIYMSSKSSVVIDYSGSDHDAHIIYDAMCDVISDGYHLVQHTKYWKIS